MNLVKIYSADLNSITQRVIKFLRFGSRDVQTAIESGPHGIDSFPVKDTVAIYAPTGNAGETVIVGYLLRDKLAQVGETRLYSTSIDGTLKTYIWLKNDGIMHFGGDADYVVSFNNLKTEFEKLQNKWDAFAAAYVPGSPSVTGLPATLQASGANIDNAKNTNIKTIAP